MSSRVVSLCRWAVIALGFASAQLPAQQVSVRMHPPPPNELTPADVWECDITALDFSQEVFLLVNVNEAKSGLVASGKSSSFLLRPGMRTVSSRAPGNLGPLTLTFPISSFRDVVTKTGAFPTGDYQICVTVRSLGGNAVAGVILATDCFDQHVEASSQPMLIAPYNESDVDLSLPLFSWTQPVAPRVTRTGAPFVAYRLRIVEVLGRQSPEAAMQGNPAWFERDGITSTAIQLPPTSRRLEKGHRYAWNVTALGSGFVLGTSEVWEFTFQPPEGQTVKSAQVPQTQIKKPPLDVLEELLNTCGGK